MALTFVPKLGVRGAVHLLRCFGSAAAIYSASEDELRSRAELRADIARDIANGRAVRDAERRGGVIAADSRHNARGFDGRRLSDLCCARSTTTPP